MKQRQNVSIGELTKAAFFKHTHLKLDKKYPLYW